MNRSESTSRYGFALVELLLAIGILAILTWVIGAALVDQQRAQRKSEAKNEVQTNIRAALEAISADLYNAGSRGVYGTCSITGSPVTLDSSAPRSHILTVKYCSPYNLNTPVTVEYKVAADPANSNTPSLFRNSVAMVPGVLGLEFEFTCSGGSQCTPPVASPLKIVTAKLKLAARNIRRTYGVKETYTFDGSAVGGTYQEDGYYYQYVTRLVRVPNL